MRLLTIIAATLLLGRLHASHAADIVLEAKSAKIEGVEDRANREGKALIGSWSSTNLVARWSFEVPARSTYRIFVNLACPPYFAGSKLDISVGNQKATCAVPSTGGWDTYSELDIGPIILRKPGPAELTAQVTQKGSRDALNLRSIRLVPEP